MIMSQQRIFSTRRRPMAIVAAMALLSVMASFSLARCEARALSGTRPNSPRRWLTPLHDGPWKAFSPSLPATSFDCSGQVRRDRSSSDAEQERALTLLRGGGGNEIDASVFTLFVRVFVPTFERDEEAREGGIDLRGGGLMRRLQRLCTGILRSLTGFNSSGRHPQDARKSSRDGQGTKKGKNAKKGREATASHLETAYRPGNANYRIQKELKEFMANPPDNCKVSVGKNIRVWIITINGAEGTIYAGEKFRLRVAFPDDYPTKPPAVYFLQTPPPPKHQHIYSNGDICLSLLSTRDWKPNLTVMSLALSILSMLSSAKEKRLPEDNASHADAKPGQAQQWIYHDDTC